MSRYVCMDCGLETDPASRGCPPKCANCGSSNLDRRSSPAEEEYGRGDPDEVESGVPGGSGGRVLDVVELMERRPRRREVGNGE